MSGLRTDRGAATRRAAGTTGTFGAMFGESIDLAIFFFVTAVFYSAVGQAGASGYLAAMGLVGLAPAVMKPTALALNLLVAAIGAVRLARAGYFRWRTFFPFAVLGMPFSFLGGAINLPERAYYPLVGALLIIAAVLLVHGARGVLDETPAEGALRDPPFWPALLAGAGVGLLSGMTGTGGGIFLAPLILVMGWVETRRTSAVAAAYNLLNSAAALGGTWVGAGAFPAALPAWLAVAGVGALIGSWLGLRLAPSALRHILAAILVISGVRMILA